MWDRSRWARSSDRRDKDVSWSIEVGRDNHLRDTDPGCRVSFRRVRMPYNGSDRFRDQSFTPVAWRLKSMAVAVLLVSIVTSGAIALPRPGSTEDSPEKQTRPVALEKKQARLPVPDAPSFGTIKGRLVWGDEQIPTRRVLVPRGEGKPDPDICAKKGPLFDESLVIDRATKGVRHAVAYLVNPIGRNDGARRALARNQPMVTLDGEKCVFRPHALAMHEDQLLRFRTTDPISHCPHVTSYQAELFPNTISDKNPKTRKMVADNRAIPITCDIHPWMKAYIMVFDHPFFAVTAEDGSFEIAGVPAAKQKLVVWQETVGYVTPGRAQGMPIQIKAGEVTDAGSIKMGPFKRRDDRPAR